MVWLAGLLPYEQAEQVFARIGQARVPATSIWQQTQVYGETLKIHQAHQQAQVSVERVVLPPAGQDHPDRCHASGYTDSANLGKVIWSASAN
jgi:hypothetical protein